MKVFLGADHRGYKLKEEIKSFLSEKGIEIKDMGALTETPGDDYVDYAKAVSLEVVANGGLGILFCGSGAGVEIAANKINGIRACIGFNKDQVRAAREDDNVNVLSVSSDFIELDNAKEIISSFLSTEFNPTENHLRRIDKVKALDD